MSVRNPDWDINWEEGHQAQLWVEDLQKALRGGEKVEVKAPKPFLREQSFYVEFYCLRGGKWQKSGIATTKSPLQFFTFGNLPGGLVVETEWLKRAVKIAHKNPLKRKQCKRGSHPTKGVVVSLSDLWAARERDP